MPKWTDEQQLAIDKENTNIIVSAGAGSGKTAVLTARTIRKLKSGVDIDRLLILTFTHAAAFEMMMRIRDGIKQEENLKPQLDKIDSSYITTFDSYALSLVKKYHYVLNVSKDVKIVDQTIIDIEKRKILENIFDEYYTSNNENFLKLIDNFTLKDDKEIKKLILNINNKLDLKFDKTNYLLNYINNNYNDNIIDEYLKEFEDLIKKYITTIKENTDIVLSEIDEKNSKKLLEYVGEIISSNNYDELIKHLDGKNPTIQKLSYTAKNAKDTISETVKKLKEICVYSSTSSIKELYNETSSYVKIIIDIILKLDNEIYNFKYKNDCYEFVDISKMAINLVKNNSEIRDEIKYYFNEIMIDEYQDTSDLQELFIAEIENNNVYMVGDIKQSIYRFRNANPYIFKNKYDNYAKNLGGFKIDLNKNFRSREEVLNNINFIFDLIMDDKLGGASYKKEHQMIFGNGMYTVNKKEDQNSDFEIFNYKLEKDRTFSSEEVEAFIILKDIKDKVDAKYQIIDKETTSLRDITYSDFAILLDRSVSFDLYKKIFEYYKVPLSVYKDTSITDEVDIYLISNIFNIIKKVKNKEYDKTFIKYFMSIARSYLFAMDDEYIFKTIVDKKYDDTSLIKKVKNIVADYDNLDGAKLLDEVIREFDIYRMQLGVGEIDKMIARTSYLNNLLTNMTEMGYGIDEIIDNFNIMIEEKYDIKCSLNEESSNAVKIMTIHKSKGLEFPICYFAGFTPKFNIKDIKERIIFDNKYGIIVPFFKEKEMNNITKLLAQDLYIKEEISEKIRLLYVALTRAKEKMIIVTRNEDEIGDECGEIVSDNIREKYISFLDIMKSIWGSITTYQKNIDITSLNLNKDYNKIKEFNFKDSIKKNKNIITFKTLDFNETVEESSSFSKKTNSLIMNEEKEMMELGTYFHYVFETIDFKKPDYSFLDDFYKNKVKEFLKLDIFENLNNLNIYKEYEFLYEDDGIKHGIIDLMLESNSDIKIIDYKLKSIKDDAYMRQLNGYKKYIQSKTDKDISVYLYSILDNKLEKLN